jgi:pyruvate dehydrogenase E2 component (dihydrolipoamide acetyltransferase)
MTYEFRLPDIGEGVHEGEITKWAVAAGAVLARDQAVVEVMTDKATVELTSPVAGKLAETKAEVGQVVKVGSVLFIIDDGKAEVSTNLAGHGGGAAAPAPAAAPAAKPTAPPAPVRAAAPPAAPAATPVAASAPPRPAPAPAMPTKAPIPMKPAAALASVPLGKVLAAPATRRMAREAGVDITQIPGTGPHGRVTREDIEKLASAEKLGSVVAEEAPAAPMPSAVSPAARPAAAATLPFVPLAIGSAAEDTRIPFRGLRRKIAEAMVRSKRSAAHFTVVEDLDVTELVKVREKAKAIGLAHGIHVTYMPFIMKAIVIGLRENPSMNAALDETTQEIVLRGAINFGIAVDTPDGLIVPVIQRADSKGVLQLAKELGELAERTRTRKVSIDDLQGSTFTITNAGNMGGIFATPVINYPEVAILGVHRIRREPGIVVRDGKEVIEPRSFMMLSCSIDHRLVDGATGARFLARLKQLLEEPALLTLA